VDPGPSHAPPDRLWHGTTASRVDVVLREGLRPMGRAFVHLSDTLEQARAVGARHGTPVVVLVDAIGAAAEGVAFHRGGRGTWLARGVPADHLTRHPHVPGGTASR
jgi:putative RNA 2'-phosphotransferase